MPRKRNSLNDFLESVGDNIRRIRLEKGFTLEEVGSDIGLDKSNMFRVEQGRNITLLTLAKIAATLDVSPSELLHNDITIAREDAFNYAKKKRSK